MKFKRKLRKDLRFRKNYMFNEINHKVFKSIWSNLALPFGIRYLNFLKLTSKKKKVSSCKFKNYCVFTGRSRSIFTFFKFSRIQLKERAKRATLTGVTKATW